MNVMRVHAAPMAPSKVGAVYKAKEAVAQRKLAMVEIFAFKSDAAVEQISPSNFDKSDGLLRFHS